MIRQLTATDAKTTLLALLDEVVAGNEIEITRYGHTVARLVPAKGPHSLKGKLSGIAHTAAPKDDDLYSTQEHWNVL